MTTLRARNALGSRSSGMRRALLCGAALSGFAAMPSTAFAQDAETAEEIPEDRVIIVQARKQSESLQEVPVTVTAIGSEALEKYNVDQVADVVSRVPTLNVQVGGSGSGGTISLRGVGSSAISSAFDSAVAFGLDGIQVSTLRLVAPTFSQLSRQSAGDSFTRRGWENVTDTAPSNRVSFTAETISENDSVAGCHCPPIRNSIVGVPDFCFALGRPW